LALDALKKGIHAFLQRDARGVASAVAGLQNNAPPQHHPTKNRELAVAVLHAQTGRPKRAARPHKGRTEGAAVRSG